MTAAELSATTVPNTPTVRPIRELPAAVAAQIAAGEVVERPAAALKELLENALDAGARRIEAAAEGAGLERLAVRDDGCGIPADQLALAFRRHATSKLERAEQLWSLDSYGFRGEALPALAAAAGRLEAESRAAGARDGARIVFERGRPLGVEPCARAAGTAIELRELFAAQPARRAFLPGPRAERAALARAAADAALARPEVGLRLELDGRAALRHDPAGDAPEAALREAWAAVFGAESAERAIWWREADQETGLIVEGLAGAPRDARRGRAGMRLFVNGRPVRDRSLAWALQEAYRGRIAEGRFPLAAARLALPAAAVDVNVHPTKAEVQLREPARAFSLLQRSLRAALATAADPTRPALRPRRSDPDLEWAPLAPDAGAVQGRIDERTAPPAQQSAQPAAQSFDQSNHVQPATVEAAAEDPRRALPASDAPNAPPAPSTLNANKRGLAPLRMVGQLHRTFIIAEGERGLALVDQHAAHERVLYERLLAARGAGAAARQPLLDPPVVQLDAAEAAIWSEAAARLDALGFELDAWGERALRLRAVPALGERALLRAAAGRGGTGGADDTPPLGAGEAERWLREVLAELAEDPRGGRGLERGGAGRGADDGSASGGAEADGERFDRVAASVACHASVRRGAALDQPAMAALLRQLEGCADPHSCPHGRPTMVEIAAADLLREFGRA